MDIILIMLHYLMFVTTTIIGFGLLSLSFFKLMLSFIVTYVIRVSMNCFTSIMLNFFDAFHSLILNTLNSLVLGISTVSTWVSDYHGHQEGTPEPGQQQTGKPFIVSRYNVRQLT
jgi:hypothetical protein